MVNYECKRCGYNTKHKGSFINHLNRKKICIPILEDASIESLKYQYRISNPEKLQQNSTQTAPFSTQTALFSTQMAILKKSKQHPNSTQTAPKQHPNSTQIAPKIIMCVFCEKTFTRKTGLTKHLKCCKIKHKNYCDKSSEFVKLKKEHDTLKDHVEDLLIELSERSQNPSITNNYNTTHNTNNTTNNQNKIINISINNYGNENIEYLKNDYLHNLLTGAFTAIPKLIEKIHFNPQHPENHNIKITNKKEPYIKVRKNDKWELQDKKETLETLVDDKYYILEDYYSEINSDVSDHTKKVMSEFRDKFNDDKELQKDIQKKSEMVILNNS